MDIEERRLDGLRVLHISTVHHASDTRIRLKECRSLAQAGAEVRLAARRSSVDVGPDQIDVAPLPDYHSRAQRVFFGLRDVVREARRQRPHVVHIHDPELLLVVPLLQRHAKAVIYDVHESYRDIVADRQWIHPLLRAPISRLVKVGEPMLARQCTAVVLVDGRWRDRFATDHAATCPNTPLRGELTRTAEPHPPTQPHFVYVGELLPERGLAQLVDAANMIEASARVTLAGPISDTFAADLRRRDRLGRLRMTGRISRDEVRDLLEGATAGVVLLKPSPAYDGAYSTKIFEYADAGLPIIFSDNQAHRELTGRHTLGPVVHYGDTQALASAMTELSQDRNRWSTHSSAARAFARTTTRWDETALALIELYATIAQRWLRAS